LAVFFLILIWEIDLDFSTVLFLVDELGDVTAFCFLDRRGLVRKVSLACDCFTHTEIA